MSVARYYPGSALLPNGKVLVMVECLQNIRDRNIGMKRSKKRPSCSKGIEGAPMFS